MTGYIHVHVVVEIFFSGQRACHLASELKLLAYSRLLAYMIYFLLQKPG